MRKGFNKIHKTRIGLLLVFVLLFSNVSLLGVQIQVGGNTQDLPQIEQEERGLIGFEGEYELSDDDTPVSVIVLFENEPAAVQVEEAQIQGFMLSESVAENTAEDDHALFRQEMAMLFGARGRSVISPYEIPWEYHIALNGVNVVLPSNKVEELANFKSVKVIYPDYALEFEQPPIAEPITSQQVSSGPAGMRPGRESMRADKMHEADYKGKGVVVAVLDTGIDYNHPAFKDAFLTINEMQARGVNVSNADGMEIDGVNYFAGRNFLSGNYENPSNDPMEVVPLTPGVTGGTNHGTHVSGSIAGRDAGGSTAVLGIAPEAKLFVYRMISNTQGAISNTVAAIEHTVYDKADVVNMSWGYAGYNKATSFASVAINNVMLAYPNMIFVASAGNDGSDPYTITSPGAGSKYITVANVNIRASWIPEGTYELNTGRWSVASTSSRGPIDESFEIKPDIGAQGTQVISSVPDWTDSSGYAGMSGTSMAAPHITGAAALLVEYSRKNGGQWMAGEIKSRLMNNAVSFDESLNFSSGVFATGAGYADVYAAAHADTVVSVNYDRAVTGSQASNLAYHLRPFSNTKTGSFSFGKVGNSVNETNTLSLLSQPAPNVRTLSAGIKNNSRITRTYSIEHVFENNPGNAMTLTISHKNITVASGRTVDFTATASVGGNVAGGFYEGHVYVRDGDRLIARLPFALVSERTVNVQANKLSFDLGDATDLIVPKAIDSINVLSGTNIHNFLTNYHKGYPSYEPIREGYNFLGWYLDAALTKPLTNMTLMPGVATTLYAYWKEKGTTQDIIIPCTTSDGTRADSIYINLTQETITLGRFEVKAYSVNGGKKWKKGSLPVDKKFNALFDKALQLWVTDIIDSKGRPAGNAEILKFPEISARPKANAEKLVPFYNGDNSTWVLAKKGDATGTSVYTGYEYCDANADGKTPMLNWKPVSQSGFDVTEKPAKGVKKKTYFVRKPAEEYKAGYIPASKQFKVVPAVFAATPKLKINYKKEILNVKRGLSYSVDGGNTYKTVDDRKGFVLDIPDYITSNTSINIRLNASGKKPASLIQVITPFERGRIAPASMTCAKGKIVTKLSMYEILNPADGKWGGLPKTKSSTQYYIRLKQTKTAAKSEIYILDIEYGLVNATKKNGIIAATIIKPPRGDTPRGDISADPSF